MTNTKIKLENSTGLYLENIFKIKVSNEKSHLMTYIDIYKILSFQYKLINIYENAIHFCKNTVLEIILTGDSIVRNSKQKI